MKQVIKVAGIAAATITLSVFTGGSASAISIEGTNRADNLVGTAGKDRIRALAGADRVAGLSGEDRLRGERGNDTMYGGAGPDWLFPGRGADRVYAGEQNDLVVLKRDHSPDRIFCGGGRHDAIFFIDRALGPNDRIVSCEDITYVDST
jgi:Ca2+-binding RTX toxin-like protein